MSETKTCQPTEPRGEIGESLDYIFEAAAKVAKAINELENRLHPILSQGEDAKNEVRASRGLTSELGDFLNNAEINVLDSFDRLNSIINRIKL